MGWMPGGGESVDSQACLTEVLVWGTGAMGSVLWKKTGRHRGWDLGVVNGTHRPHPEPPLAWGQRAGGAPGTGLGVELQLRLGQAG